MFNKGDKIVVDEAHPEADRVLKDAPRYNALKKPLLKGFVYVVDDVLREARGREQVFFKDQNGVTRNFLSYRFKFAELKKIFQVGDRVKIVDDIDKFYVDKNLREFDKHNGELARWLGKDREMRKYQGKEVVIAAVERADEGFAFMRYRIEGDPYHVWNNRFFEEPVINLPAYKVGDKVHVQHKPEDVNSVPKWLEAMDKTIGKNYKIKEVHKGYLILSNNRAYRMESVVPYDEKLHAAPKKKVKTLHSVMKEIRAYAKAEIEKDNLNGCCSYVRIYAPDKPNGDVTYVAQWNDVCHARLASSAKKKCIALVDFIGGHKRVVNTKPYRRFVDYIQRRSPWAVAYHAKEVKNAIISGLDMNVKVSGDVICGACIAMRMGSEYPDLTPKFVEALKYTKNENAAFLIAWAFSKLDGKEFILSNMSGGHSVLSGHLNAGKLLEFFKEGYDKKFLKPAEEKQYKNSQRYEVFKAMTGDDPYLRGNKECFEEWINKESKSELKGVAGGFGAKVRVVSQENFINLVKVLENLV